MKLALFASKTKPQAIEVKRELSHFLNQRGVEVLTELLETAEIPQNVS